ncbi:MAG: hypothetical protein R6U26_04255 [Candidatus Undinarchaeales archaeon]
MFKTTVEFKSGNELEIIEYETGHYSYKYWRDYKGTLCFRRRWEWHRNLKEGPHIHDHRPSGAVEKKFTGKKTLRHVLSEIKKEFESDINVKFYVRMVRDRR